MVIFGSSNCNGNGGDDRDEAHSEELVGALARIFSAKRDLGELSL